MTATTALPKVLEIDFQRQLVGYTKGRPSGIATILGWVHVHFRPARTKFGFKTPGTGEMAAGWPDLVLVRERDRRLIFAELKSETGKVSHDQDMVLASLRTLVLDRDEYVRKALSVLAVHDPSAARSEPVRESWAEPLPRVEVYVWRPSDLEQIAEILR